MKLVLVCDDSMFIRHLMVSMLSNLGLRTVLASNGGEGMAMVRAFQPDLVISGIDLPVMDGIELFRSVRQDATLGDLPWIMMGFPGRRPEAVLAGCDYFLPKPIKPRVLEYVVYQALGSGIGNHV